MIDTTFTFNTYDLSPLLSTLTISHNVEVAESVTTIDGEEYTASRRRVVIDFSLIPMSEATIEEVYAKLSAINGELTYIDPMTGTTRTIAVRISSNIDSVFALKSIDGNRYYKGTKITMRERTVL